jgi:hypothetical protein
LLILPVGEFEIDIAQYYEMIVLSVPLRRVHPGIKDWCLQTALTASNELAVKEIKEENKEEY